MATIEKPPAPTPAGAPGLPPRPAAQARRPFFLRSGFTLAVFLVLLVANIAGWKIVDVDPGRLVEKSPDVARFLGEVLRPDIISHNQDQIEAHIGVLGALQPTGVQPIQASDTLLPELHAGDSIDPDPNAQPYDVTVTVSDNTVAPGQEITVSGTGFRPNTGGTVLWQSTGQSASVQTLGDFTTDDKGSFTGKVKLPTDTDRVINGSGFPNTLAVRQTWDVGSAYVSDTVNLVVGKVVETIFQALIGTTFAVIISIPLSFLASRNLMSHNLLSRIVYWITRTILNLLRSIEVLILAVIFGATIGLGAFAGVLALVVHSIASLGKLYSEAIEAIDAGPIEAITATGANRLQVIVFAVVPQFIPQFIAFTLYRWDINVRMSTILGFVGGGGIGYILQQYIQLLRWNQAGTAIWAIAVVVIAIDWASSRVRAAVI